MPYINVCCVLIARQIPRVGGVETGAQRSWKSAKRGGRVEATTVCLPSVPSTWNAILAGKTKWSQVEPSLFLVQRGVIGLAIRLNDDWQQGRRVGG